MAAYIQVCPHVFDEEKSNLPPRQVRLSVSGCIMTNLTTFYFSLFNSCNIVSIRFPYSSASSKANMSSGVFLKRIALPTPDRINLSLLKIPQGASVLYYSQPIRELKIST